MAEFYMGASTNSGCSICDLPFNEPRKVKKNGPNAWAPATQMGDLAPGFNLTFPQTLWQFEE